MNEETLDIDQAIRNLVGLNEALYKYCDTLHTDLAEFAIMSTREQINLAIQNLKYIQDLKQKRTVI